MTTHIQHSRLTRGTRRLDEEEEENNNNTERERERDDLLKEELTVVGRNIQLYPTSQRASISPALPFADKMNDILQTKRERGINSSSKKTPLHVTNEVDNIPEKRTGKKITKKKK